eukprot:scaffold192082_cov41-Prasinocladus_malaysianus.AAC.1
MEWAMPAAALTMRQPTRESTRWRGPSSWNEPCPSCPCRPRPQVQRWPNSEMARVWLVPAVTETIRVRDNARTCEGKFISIGVQPPWPSSPLLAKPQVKSSPRLEIEPVWLLPQATTAGMTGSSGSLVRSSLMGVPRLS